MKRGKNTPLVVYRRPLHGFTLVELLVVISIIALLVSILMPALNKARDQAKAVACAAQMKQYGMAITYYVMDDAEGRFPYYATQQAMGIGNPFPEEVWINLLAPYMGGEKISSGDSLAVKHEKDSRNSKGIIRECPTNKAWIGGPYGSRDPTMDAPWMTLNNNYPRSFKYDTQLD